MAKIKLTKSAVDAAQPQTQAIELRDTLVPAFLCKITSAGRRCSCSTVLAEANCAFSVMRRMFNLAKAWGFRPDGTNPCRHVPMFPNGKAAQAETLVA